MSRSSMSFPRDDNFNRAMPEMSINTPEQPGEFPEVELIFQDDTPCIRASKGGSVSIVPLSALFDEYVARRRKQMKGIV